MCRSERPPAEDLGGFDIFPLPHFRVRPDVSVSNIRSVRLNLNRVPTANKCVDSLNWLAGYKEPSEGTVSGAQKSCLKMFG